MSKAAYGVIDGKNRKIKKGYATISGTHRKLKKAYSIIGGKARPFWAGGELTYYGTTTSLSAGRGGISANSIGGYAVFAGGAKADDYTNGTSYSTVDTYDVSLTKGNATTLSSARSSMGTCGDSNYILFGGGQHVTSGDLGTVDAYNASLTRTIPTPLGARRGPAAATVGNYYLFGGGCYGLRTDGSFDSVEVYNTSLTKQTNATSLSSKRRDGSGASVGNYALIGGGWYENGTYDTTSVVDAYNTSLTRSSAGSLIQAMYYVTSTNTGKYALFGGGRVNYNTLSTYVTAYSASLTRTYASLSVGRDHIGATTVEGYALFGGNNSNNVVDVFDSSLTRTTATPFDAARQGYGAATVGNYALFGGGTGSSYGHSDVYVYAVV